MDGSETYDGQSFAERSSWKGSPQPESQKSSNTQLPPLYFNTSDNPTSNAPSPYAQYQKSPGLAQGNAASTQPYNDNYRYVASPGSGRMMQQQPGLYQGGPGWPSAPQQHPPYMLPDRNRYIRPNYPTFDPSKPYNQSGLPSQGQANQHAPWTGSSHGPNHPGYSDIARPHQHAQADVAGPVVPAGLQALQANNNNATLMQHQHTPMLVPNPHYNQHKAQNLPLKNQPEAPKDESKQNLQRSTTSGPAESGVRAPNTASDYYSHFPPPVQQNNVGPIHHPAGIGSPSLSPYPTNPNTPGSTKSKARGNKCYQCPKCVKIFRRGDHLKRHLLSVHDHEHPYQCGECGKGFASVPTLSKHAKSLHIGTLSKGLMCLRCQLTFKNTQDLEVHATSLHVQEDEVYMQNINTSSKQHLCSACSKSFSSAANLKRHMQLLHRTKDETKLFCRECGKGFSRSDNLQKHMDRVHAGNFNGMPDADEQDAEGDNAGRSLSSESDSRGPSADTDESSMSGPPSNRQWTYPLQTVHPSSPSQRKDSLAQAPHSAGYQVQYNSQPDVNPQALPHVQNVLQPNQYPHQPPAPLPQTTIALGHVHQQHLSPTSQPAAADVKKEVVSTVKQNPTVASGAVNTSRPTAQSLISTPTLAPQETQMMIKHETMTAPPQRIEPKSVSEALSMAMKALSDYDYDVPGSDPYPSYPSEVPGRENQQRIPNYSYQNYSYVHQMESSRNGVATSGRPPDAVSAMPPYNSSDYSQRGGNFLMTMPPPPGMMTAGHLPATPVAADQEAPQLSLLLQEGGGGVNSPTAINENMMTQVHAAPELDQKKRSRSKKKKRKNDENQENLEGFGCVEPYGGSGVILKDGSDEGPTNFDCTICKTSYESIDSLMQHVESVHLKKNPHECCICHKKFAQAGNVKRHIRFVHLRERPFRCKDCSSTFDRLCYLQRHMRSHLQPDDGNKDFDHLKPCNCPECGKRCLTAHHLRGHMQRKHFAKNKQNYGQFLMKYRHLEAIGAGPGAITNPNKGRKGNKRKKNEKTVPSVDFLSGQQFQNGTNSSGQPFLSSALPPSSSRVNSLTAYVQQNGTLQSNMVQKTLPQLTPPFSYNTQLQLKGTPDGQSGYLSNGVSPPTTCAPWQTSLPSQFDGATKFGQYRSLGNGAALTNFPSNAGSLASAGYANKVNFSVAVETDAVVNKPRNKGRMGNGQARKKKSRKLLPYRCQRCVHRSFASLAMLKSHMSSVHNAPLKRNVCLACGASFSTAHSLRSHVSQSHQSRNVKPAVRLKKKILQPIPAVAPNTERQTGPDYASTIPPAYLAQNNLAHMVSYIPTPHSLYQYNNNPTGIVPSNVQSGYANPAHHLPTPLPLVQI